MNVELNNNDYDFIKNILERELGSTAVEIHHTFHTSYKEYLRDKEKQINEILSKFKN